VLDEAHTPLGKNNKRECAATIAPHFKSLVNDGLFALIVMGTSSRRWARRADARR
jgi:hypothetical protein